MAEDAVQSEPVSAEIPCSTPENRDFSPTWCSPGRLDRGSRRNFNRLRRNSLLSIAGNFLEPAGNSASQSGNRNGRYWREATSTFHAVICIRGSRTRKAGFKEIDRRITISDEAESRAKGQFQFAREKDDSDTLLPNPLSGVVQQSDIPQQRSVWNCQHRRSSQRCGWPRQARP